MFMALFLIYLATPSGIRGISLGFISNASLIIPFSNLTMNGSNCNECLCAMFVSVMNSSILSLNCFVKLNGVTCQLFTNEIYLSSNSFRIATNSTSTFYFQQLPQRTTTESVLTTTAVEGTYFGIKLFTRLHELSWISKFVGVWGKQIIEEREKNEYVWKDLLLLMENKRRKLMI